MTYKKATRLHSGDEVTVKETGAVLMVLFIENRLGRREVAVTCEDGYTYHHTELS